MSDVPTRASHPREFHPFWDHLAQGELRFPHCGRCGRFLWYPMPSCPECGRPPDAWRAVDGPGTLFSWTVIRRAFTPEYADEVPYVVGLVEFPDAPGVRLVTRIDDVPHEELAIGLPVRPVIRSGGGAEPRVVFTGMP